MTTPTQAQIEAALKDMLTFFGRPSRDEWMNEQAWKEAKQVCANAEAALTAAAEVGKKDETYWQEAAINWERKAASMKERCAQVAEKHIFSGSEVPGQFIAAAIRALKNNPIDPLLQYPGKDPDFVFPEEE